MWTRGVLQRMHVIANDHRYCGKEFKRKLEQGPLDHETNFKCKVTEFSVGPKKTGDGVRLPLAFAFCAQGKVLLNMSEYDKEKWVELYRAALLELEHAKMAGRLGDARTEIAARIEKLHNIPGLHAKERQAIEDALNSLRTLEREEERHAADERRIAEIALEKLRVIAPKVENSYAE